MAETTQHYDDTAALYFFLTLLALFLFPWTLSYISKLIGVFDKSHIGPCRCEECQAKEVVIHKRRRELSGFAIFKLGIFAFLWVLFIFVLINAQVPAESETNSSKTPQIEETQFGDPWEILGLQQGATPEEIRKAHKKLSIKYHPDKNKDPGAEDMFIKVTKANQILTDPEKLAIWERYGNPDGPRAVEIGIALPTWLVSGKYTSVIILVYAGLLGFIIPGGVWLWTQQQKKYTPTKVSTNTLGIYYNFLKDRQEFKKLTEVLSWADEFQFRYRPDQEADITALRSIVPREEMLAKKQKSQTKKEKTKGFKILARKQKTLFFAHFSRLDKKVPTGLKEDFQFTIDFSLKLCATLMECCLMKRLTQPALQVIRISQMITQACWNGPATGMMDTSLLQLPHISQGMLENWNRLKSEKGNKRVEKTLKDYLGLEPEAQTRLLTDVFHLDPNQIKDVRAVEKMLPTDVGLEVSADVDDKRGIITENAVVTIRFALSRPSFPALKRKNPDAFIAAHAPRLSGAVNETKEEWWWLLVSNFNAAENIHQLFHLQKIKCLRDGASFEMKLPPLKQGNYNFDVHLMCDSYIGFDLKKVLTLDVKPTTALPELVKETDREEASSEEEPDWSDEYAALSSQALLESSDSE